MEIKLWHVRKMRNKKKKKKPWGHNWTYATATYLFKELKVPLPLMKILIPLTCHSSFFKTFSSLFFSTFNLSILKIKKKFELKFPSLQLHGCHKHQKKPSGSIQIRVCSMSVSMVARYPAPTPHTSITFTKSSWSRQNQSKCQVRHTLR